MIPWAQKLESEPPSRCKVESSDPIEDVVDLGHTDQSTGHPNPEEHTSYSMSGAIVPSSNQIKLGEHTFDSGEPPSAQPGSETDNWTVEDIIEMQDMDHDHFFTEYRATAAEERSQLAQTVKSEIQAGMNQIAGYVKSVLVRSARPSTPVEVEDLKTQLKAEKTRNKELSSQYNRLVNTANHQTKELRDVKATLQDALQERDQLRRLLDGGNLANSDKSTDDAIKSKWLEIAYNIKCLAHVLRGTGSGQTVDDEVTQRLRIISRDYYTHLQDPDYHEFLMRGYLWGLIQDVVFDSQKGTCGGPCVESLKITQDIVFEHIGDIGDGQEAEASLTQVARWLAQGFSIMSKMWHKDTVGIKRMIHAETKRLRPFMEDHQSRTDRADKISEHLGDIIGSAIELDQMMLCSKAIFQIHWRDQSQKPGGVQRWNPDVMTAEAWEHEPSPKSRVLLHVSPILYKTGTADGQRYDARMVLAESVVICD